MGRGRERRQKGLDRQKIGSKTLAGRPGMSDVASCLESQGCHLIPLFYLISCVFFLSSPLSPFSLESLMVHSPVFQKTPVFFVKDSAFLYGSC